MSKRHQGHEHGKIMRQFGWLKNGGNPAFADVVPSDSYRVNGRGVIPIKILQNPEATVRSVCVILAEAPEAWSARKVRRTNCVAFEGTTWYQVLVLSHT